jgi:putative transposase
VDNGTEFTSKALGQWVDKNRSKLAHARPGNPTDNGLIESFNPRGRSEYLSQHHDSNVEGAHDVLQPWRKAYNNARPHSALGQLTPAQYRARVEATEGPKKLAHHGPA